VLPLTQVLGQEENKHLNNPPQFHCAYETKGATKKIAKKKQKIT
jgi:hypothetical protein